jgi:WD40 repeat protein
VAGQLVVIGRSESNTLTVSDLVSTEPVGELADDRCGRLTALACQLLNGRPVLISGTADGKLFLWDLASCKLRDILVLDQPVEMIIPASRGRLAVVADGDIFVFQLIDNLGASLL